MGYTFKNFTTEVLTASDLNAQFAKIENKLGNIKNADISVDARITSNKLLDRYAVSYQTVVIRTDTWGGNFTFQDQNVEGSVTEARVYPILPDKRAFLVGITMYMSGYSAGTGNGQAWFNYNGTTFATQVLDATGKFPIVAGSSPFNSPIISISDGSYIGVRLGRTATGGSTTCTSLTITFAYKIELTA